MTPKEKAEQLLNRFWFDTTLDELEQAKDCALIAVDEILNAIDWDYYEGSNQTEHNYYKEVKKELEKL